ncbi:transmembrane protein 254-like [Strongylocentrotus purpuratus]|uniref:Transmembrane protein 254 n=1 Tax=Strongylocentrotus purpuratus TaxID=7668 RepID=A0A7M7NM15_STRPU|nr:transmembrane protein 254-like [Strongylocentrotus purpuratus]
MALKRDPGYFKLPNMFVMFLIAFGMTLTAMCVYAPDKIPYHYLGFLGDLAKYLAYQRPRLIEAIWYMAVSIHVSEAIYAFYLAGQKGITGQARILWFIFTLGFGIGSLINLLKYDLDSSADPVGELLFEFGYDKEDDDLTSLSKDVSAIEVNKRDAEQHA